MLAKLKIGQDSIGPLKSGWVKFPESEERAVYFSALHQLS
jgi:hypothetical protein